MCQNSEEEGKNLLHEKCTCHPGFLVRTIKKAIRLRLLLLEATRGCPDEEGLKPFSCSANKKANRDVLLVLLAPRHLLRGKPAIRNCTGVQMLMRA